MASLILLVVVAAWLAVLIPPLLRSRLENRPNSSVSDFRNQLSSLQRAMPPTRTVTMRAMGRPLAPSPLARPAAAGRPVMRSGVRTHGLGTTRSAGQQAAVRPRPDVARAHDASLRGRSHGEPRQHAVPADDRSGDVKRRRANVVFVLALIAGCSTFLALTTKAQSLVYLAGAAAMSIVAYAYVVGQAGRRAAPRQPARPAARQYRGQRAVDGDVRRERTHRVERVEAHEQPRPRQANRRVHQPARDHRDLPRQRGHRDDARSGWANEPVRNNGPRRQAPMRRPVDRWSPAV